MKKLLLLIFITSLPFFTQANISKHDPYKMIHQAANLAFKRFANVQDKIKKDPNILKTIVREELLPYIDYRYAAYKVLGSRILKKTTKKERNKFVIIFRDYLVSQYAQVFVRYNNQKVTFEPSRDFSNKKILSIKTIINDPKLGVIDIAFKVRRNRHTNEWKVFDLVAEGVSLLDAKQAELSGILRQKGLAYVDNLLQQKTAADIVLPKTKKH